MVECVPCMSVILALLFSQNEILCHLSIGESPLYFSLRSQPSPETSKNPLLFPMQTPPRSPSYVPLPSSERIKPFNLLNDPNFGVETWSSCPLNWIANSPSYQSMEPRVGSSSEGQVGVMEESGFIKDATVRARGGGERLGQGCCQVLTASEAFRIIQETVAPGCPGGVVGLRSESLTSAKKRGFQLEEAAGVGVGGMLDILPSAEVGQVMGEGQSDSPRMEEMRASPEERAGVAGALQFHPPPFVSSMDMGKKEGSFKTSHTHTHTHTPLHMVPPRRAPQQCSWLFWQLRWVSYSLLEPCSFSLFLVPLSVTPQLGTTRRVRCNSRFGSRISHCQIGREDILPDLG